MCRSFRVFLNLVLMLSVLERSFNFPWTLTFFSIKESDTCGSFHSPKRSGFTIFRKLVPGSQVYADKISLKSELSVL